MKHYQQTNIKRSVLAHFGKYADLPGDQFISIENLCSMSAILIDRYHSAFEKYGDRCTRINQPGISDETKLISVNGMMCEKAVKIDANLYHLDFDMGEALLQTGYMDALGAIRINPESPLPIFQVLVPKGLISNENGDSISSIIVGELWNPVAHSRILSITYFGSTGVTGQCVSKLNIDGSVGREATSGSEDHFATGALSISLQIIMLMQHEIEYIESTPKQAHQKGFGVRKLYPRKIGIGISAPKQKPIGTHRSPLAHWRKGHWRKQRYGVGSQSIALKWIRPVYVGSFAQIATP